MNPVLIAWIIYFVGALVTALGVQYAYGCYLKQKGYGPNSYIGYSVRESWQARMVFGTALWPIVLFYLVFLSGPIKLFVMALRAVHKAGHRYGCNPFKKGTKS